MQKDTTDSLATSSAQTYDVLNNWELGTSAVSFVMVFALLVVLPGYDLYEHVLPPSWRGTANGVLGGAIGVFAFIASKLRDDERLRLTVLGKEPASKEHVSYLRNRLLSGIPSGFVLSALLAAYLPNSTDALLTAAGIVGGASSTLLSTVASAVETFAAKLGNPRKPASTSRSSRIVRQRHGGSGQKR
ncbi:MULTISPECIES: hypothetical protein [Burkholderia]|uniref:hypothetical protein n=1 Tax=Burkholderia TaxID=32008 RepID=UPI000F808C74|nr:MULTISPECIES: hypothetical protein [Burkholderia]MEB2540118.1 hypothetical protein [Burkholderia cenocepacia]TGN99169.1 hypothetical protein PL79_000405 [Burkholderia sp. USMB20]